MLVRRSQYVHSDQKSLWQLFKIPIKFNQIEDDVSYNSEFNNV